MMICISTSNNLCKNVLHCAGSEIQTDYKERHQEGDALLLKGGSTKAQKILFVPWETDIQQTETEEIQKVLFTLQNE